jgi:polysaccharide biosynthesis transport protein
MEFSGYLGVLRRWWLTLIVAAVLAALAGYLVASQMPRTYQAETRLLIGPINADQATQRASGQLALTYAELATSQPLLQGLISEFALDMSTDTLSRSVTAVANDLTRLVAIRVRAADPVLAANMANGLAEALSRLTAETGIAAPEGQIVLIEPAVPGSSPVAPQVALIVLLAAAAGFLAAVMAVLLIEYMGDRIRSADEVKALTDAPLLARLPMRVKEGRPILIPGHPAYGQLTARLELVIEQKEMRRLLITGAHGDSGSGIVAATLAVGLAARGHRTAVIDADAGRPEVLASLGLEAAPPADSAAGFPVHRVALPNRGNLMVVAGSPAGREVGANEVRALLDELAAGADILIIAAPPGHQATDTLLWLRFVDAAILAVPTGVARRQDVAVTLENLSLAQVELAGVVLTEPAGRVRPLARAQLPARTAAGARGLQTKSPGASPGMPPPNGPRTAAVGPAPRSAIRDSES